MESNEIMDYENEVKDWIVLEDNHAVAKGVSRGLLVGEFDTREEAIEFIKKMDNPERYTLMGPRQKEKVIE